MKPEKKRSFCAMVPAAGAGARMRQQVRKTFLSLDSTPLLMHTLERISAVEGCENIILAVHPEDQEKVKTQYGAMMAEKFNVIRIIPGGETRQMTVMKMLQHVPDKTEMILIHDGARPLVRPRMAEEVVDAAVQFDGGAIAAVPAAATVKEVDSAGMITATPPRSCLWMAQTPQAFHKDAVTSAYEKARRQNWSATDDAEIVEKAGYEVAVRMGSYDNIKVTNPEDLEIAKAILRCQKKEGIKHATLM